MQAPSLSAARSHCGMFTGVRRAGMRAHARHALSICNATHNIAVLSGDGIGPEIMSVALEVLQTAGKANGEEFVFKNALIGGAAIDATGDPYPDATYQTCKASDAVLLAAIGG